MLHLSEVRRKSGSEPFTGKSAEYTYKYAQDFCNVSPENYPRVPREVKDTVHDDAEKGQARPYKSIPSA